VDEIHKPEDTAVQVHRMRCRQKTIKTLRGASVSHVEDNLTHPNMQVIRVPLREKKKQWAGTGKISEEIMAPNFPNFKKTIKPEISVQQTEAQET